MAISNLSPHSGSRRAQAAVRLLRRLTRDELSQVLTLMPELSALPTPTPLREATPQYWRRVLREERGDYHPGLDDEFLGGLTYRDYFACSAAEQDAFWDRIFQEHAWEIEDFEEVDVRPDIGLAAR